MLTAMKASDPDTCETCDNSGYVWRKGPDGKDWMYDCDNDDCNAFGQMDDCEESELPE